MKLKLITLIGLFALGLAFNANAGSVVDLDGDLVPDVYDNCSDAATGANGPNETSNQVDSDQDGYGNHCDADYDNDGALLVNIPDFTIFLAAFTGTTPNAATDHNGDGFTTVADFGTFLGAFQAVGTQVGPSGLACAGTIPCLP